MRTSLVTLLTNYGILLQHREFRGYALCSSLMMPGLLAYIAGTPFIYIEIFHVRPEHYGFLFGVNVVGMMAGNAINAKIVGSFGSALILRASCLMASLFGLLLLFLLALNRRACLTCNGFILSIVLGRFGRRQFHVARDVAFLRIAGSASALMGTMQFGSGAIAAWAVGYFSNGTAFPMDAIICAAGCGSFIANLLLCSSSRRLSA